MSEQLQQAYNALMVKAPGAAFQKARALYLNKYPLPQADGSAPLRLYVCDEQLEESIQPANDGDPNHRLAILRSRPGQLAVVHWQQPIRRNRSNCAATCRTPGRSTRTSFRSRPSAPPGSGRAGIKAALPHRWGWAGNNKPS